MGYLTKLNIPICCGFASQMAQYAGLYSIAKSCGLELVFVKEYLYGTLYNGAYNYCLDIPFVNKPKLISAEELKDKQFVYVEPKNNNKLSPIDLNLFKLDNKKNYIIDGDVGLYKYYHQNIDDLKKLFTFKQEYIEHSLNFLNKNVYNDEITVSISFRRGDYLQLASLNLSLEYFYKAVEKIKELIPDKKIKYLIFSGAAFGDSGMSWVKENFKIDNAVYVEGLDKFQQLSLMSICNHNIISNSSFPWMAAYLNTNKDRKVICPYNYVNDKRPDIEYLNGNYFPSDWIAIKQN